MSSTSYEKETDYSEWHCKQEACGDQLLQVINCKELGEDRHYVSCVCPNCGDPKRGVFSSELVDVLDDEIEYAQDCILEDLQKARSKHMRQYALEFFVRLSHDDITPISFYS